MSSAVSGMSPASPKSVVNAVKSVATPAPPPTPQVAPLPPSPNGQDPEVAKRMEAAAAAERLAQGRASTLLTGGDGDTSQATTAKRTLLGA